MIVSAAQARDTPITYPTLESLLLTTERRMVVQNVPMMEGTTVDAFMAYRGRGGGGRGNPSQRGVAQRGYNPRNNNNQQNNPGNAVMLASCGDRIFCQICGKPGHPALDCY
ncbi:hypothetical protein ACFX2I_025999 [Malus domestica]